MKDTNCFELRIEILDNAAFTDNRNAEAARILREVANKMENGRDGGFCIDYNGNTVGQWDFYEEDY